MAQASAQDQIEHTKSQSLKPRASRRGLKRTVAWWGITGPEVNRLNAAFYFMEEHCYSSRRVGLWFLTTDAGTSRELIADVWKRITKLQGACGLHCYSVITFESRGGLHAHIVFLGIPDIAGRLRASKQFGHAARVCPVSDPHGLFRYLSKERTPQAGYRRVMLGIRLRGSHGLPGGGDRVRLSRRLERDAIEGGHIERWQHENAKRQPEGTRSCGKRCERHSPSGERQ
jgi:hypothetical protein